MATRLLTTQRIVNLSANPSSGTAGEIYFNTVDSELKVYDGSAWSALGGGGGGSSITVSDSAPVSPASGSLWYNSSNGRTYIYYEDIDSSQWIEIGTAAIDPTGNYDAGVSNTIYGGVTGIDAGGVT
jgi:hypothetical protein